jgi:Domain of unknown function (DUF4440)
MQCEAATAGADAVGGWSSLTAAMTGAIQRGKSATLAAMSQPAMQFVWPGALAVCILVAAFAITKAQPKPQSGADDATPVAMADTALGEAIRQGDRAAARRLLSLQFSFVEADGKLRVRKDFLSDLKSLAAPPSYDATVRLYGLIGVVTGHRASADGREVFFLHIWARQKNTWRALLMQDVAIATAGAPPAAVAAPATDPQQPECKNPCQTIPYRVRSPDEQEIVVAFQEIERAVVAHDAPEWGKHVADEFVRYASGQAPVDKSQRITTIERQKATDAAVTIGEVETMRLAVYGDGAAMIATHVTQGNSRPPYRAARVWVQRNGEWLMAISVQTEIGEAAGR